MKKLVILSILLCSYHIIAAQEVAETGNWSLLTSTDKFPSNDGHLLTIPDLGLFYTDCGILFSLDSVKSQNISQVRFIDDFPFDKLIVNDGTFLVKSQQFVLQIDADKTKMVTELDTEAFDIYSGHDGKYNLVVQEDSALWTWYSCDLNTLEMECIVRIEEPISLIYDAQAAKFCVVGNRIYMTTDESMELLTEAEEPILDFVMTKAGILFCTEHTLYSINADMQTDIFAIDRFHSLYYDNGTLYIVLQNGDIMKSEI